LNSAVAKPVAYIVMMSIHDMMCASSSKVDWDVGLPASAPDALIMAEALVRLIIRDCGQLGAPGERDALSIPLLQH
jgi:hypothetical protein